MILFGGWGGKAYGLSIFHLFLKLSWVLEQNKITFVNDHDIIFVSSEVELGVVLDLFVKITKHPIISKLFAIAFNQSFIGDQEVDSLNASQSQKHESKSRNDSGLADSSLQLPNLSLVLLKS